MTLDETARAAAERLIGRFGTIATLRRATRTYDPATGKAVESTRDYRVRLSPPTRFHEARIDGTLIEAGDMATQMAAKGAPVVPDAASDTVILGETAWTLVRVDPVMSGAKAAYYDLHLRR